MSTMTSVCGEARLIRSSSSIPSISRMDRSVITRSNGPSSPRRDSASRPEAAVATRKPSWTSASRVISRIRRSSSTTSTRLSIRPLLPRSCVSVAQDRPSGEGDLIRCEQGEPVVLSPHERYAGLPDRGARGRPRAERQAKRAARRSRAKSGWRGHAAPPARRGPNSDAAALDLQPPLGVELDRLRVELALDLGDAARERLGRVVLAHVDRALQDDRPRVVLLVAVVDRRAGHLRAVLEHRAVHPLAVEAVARERGDQRGMRVHRAAVVAAQLDLGEKAGQHEQLRRILREHRVQRVVERALVAVRRPRDDVRRNPVSARPLEPERRRLRRDHRRELHVEPPLGPLLDQVLERGPAPDRQHRDSQGHASASVAGAMSEARKPRVRALGAQRGAAERRAGGRASLGRAPLRTEEPPGFRREALPCPFPSGAPLPGSLRVDPTTCSGSGPLPDRG